jgi:hypothetical protein
MNLPSSTCRKYIAGRVALSITTKSHKDQHSKSMSGQGIPPPRLKDNRLLLPSDDVDLATYGFGVGNFYLMNGEKDKARPGRRSVISPPKPNLPK